MAAPERPTRKRNMKAKEKDAEIKAKQAAEDPRLAELLPDQPEPESES